LILLEKEVFDFDKLAFFEVTEIRLYFWIFLHKFIEERVKTVLEVFVVMQIIIEELLVDFA